ncbi:MAG: acyltransferase [Mariprofundaceae bacterium]
MNKNDYIDAVRGFAILGVIALHTFYWVSPSSEILIKIAREGGKGVQLFFIISAMTLFLSIHYRQRSDSYSWMPFFIRRFCRIAPMFYLAIIVYYGSAITQGWAPNGTQWWFTALTVVFAHGWHPETFNSIVPGGWTIAIEATFYLCIPYFFIKLKNIRVTCAALLLSLVLAFILGRSVEYFTAPLYSDSQQYIVTFFAGSWFFSQLPVFIMGILLFHMIDKYPHKDMKLGILLMGLFCYLSLVLLDFEGFANLLPKHIAYAMALCTFILSLHFFPNRLCVNVITIWIGRFSFSIYLVHFMIIQILRGGPGDTLQGDSGFFSAFFLVLLISASISYFTYHCIELPGVALGKRWVQKLKST